MNKDHSRNPAYEEINNIASESTASLIVLMNSLKGSILEVMRPKTKAKSAFFCRFSSNTAHNLLIKSYWLATQGF